MSRIHLETGRVLSAPTPPRPAEAPPARTGKSDFGEALLEAVGKADAVARAADRASEGLVAGTVPIHEALLAMEKAKLVLELGTTVRNKVLEAYREVMNAAA